MLIDAHAHLHFDRTISDIDNIIKRAKQNNVSYILNSGTDMEGNKKTLELSKKYDIIKPSFGLYPVHASNLSEKDFQKELDFIKQNKKNIWLIGEVGLDFKEDKNFKKQKETFQKIIELTEKLNLPILIHSRKAEQECIEILETSKIKNIIMHCFSGKFRLVKRITDNNWYFSIPTIITRLLHFQKIVEETNISNLLTETDTPYLSPYFGKTNEPSFITETIKKISEIKKLDKEETEKIIFTNFQKIFLKNKK
ncbi:MAG: TatD family hydrolase [Nanoarchaeota archaeon]|nr:TatD family hydrolase [Nanoarchaeota archaeon]